MLGVRRLTAEDLRRSTLRRQFPDLGGRDSATVEELFRRLGPIQSQVPRSPFLTASSRLPGVAYATICELFEAHRLLKSSTLRNTVHTTVRDYYPLTDVISRPQRATWLRSLGLERVTPDELIAEVEAFADDWRPRADIVAHVRAWLATHESAAAAGALGQAVQAGAVWSHSGLIRRPKDRHWEKRTDTFHRRVRSLLPEMPVPDVATALAALVRVHLAAYGPAQREDLAFFCGAGLGAVDRAIAALGDELVQLTGPDAGRYLDLAEPPSGGSADPGLRMLPEFDGLLIGFQGRHRFRFLTEQQLPQVWAKVNGLFSPVVLHDGRLVASWKTISKGRRTDIVVTMLDPHPVLADDLFADAVAATARVLELAITDLRIRPAAS